MTDRLALARTAFAAFNRRDLETCLEVFGRDVEWWPLRSSTEGPYRGHDGIRAWFADTAETFDRLQIEVEDLREGDDLVLAHGWLSVKGRGSGAAVDVPVAWVFRVVEDKVVWGKSYSDREEALAEAGLDE
ncbi:MAG: SnoaL-like polyketide cyclase [Actinomycetota bacterium]|jgi:ketosteroid isomerase-like protein|nr:SnoaL-like polyketide cyclase [Actinomycetota bacterium]